LCRILSGGRMARLVRRRQSCWRERCWRAHG
jgi:hypothetical protein